ncbi:MAG: type II secretion system F family protein [Alphaproteobacteria bacterium]|nr:type II secretion system F family protein [Alphaproteobacteria bacterium]
MGDASPANILSDHLVVRLGRLAFSSLDLGVVIVALAVALASAFALWRIGDREDRHKRLLRALRSHAHRRSYPTGTQRQPWYLQLGTQIASMRIIGVAKQQSLLAALAAAGLRGHGHLSALIAGKVCTGILLVPLGWLFIEWQLLFVAWPVLRLALLTAACIFGWRLPDIILRRLKARRQLQLENGLPDALDLLVICAEAGLSLDHAIENVGRALRRSSPEVAKEFTATAAEMLVLPVRSRALENMAERAGLANLRSIVVTLIQSIEFGTSLSASLRVLATEMRAKSLARFEERAARLPVLLTLPLMAFVLPSLMLVIGTPLVLHIVDMLAATP